MSRWRDCSRTCMPRSSRWIRSRNVGGESIASSISSSEASNSLFRAPKLNAWIDSGMSFGPSSVVGSASLVTMVSLTSSFVSFVPSSSSCGLGVEVLYTLAERSIPLALQYLISALRLLGRESGLLLDSCRAPALCDLRLLCVGLDRATPISGD